jgi:anti-sigma B factor antagonist
VDSSGVGAIVSLHKEIKSMDGTLRIVGLRDQPRVMFNLLRLDKVLSY